MNIIIVGGGIMGLSTARSLAQTGHRITVVERCALPNPLASSSDHHRIIRFMYGDRHGYAEMVAQAFPAWERLWRDLGRIHYVPTGQLLTGPEQDPWVAGSRRSLEALGVAWTNLDRATVRRQFPLVDATQVDHALYSPTAGALLADRIVSDLIAWLAEAGVTLVTNARVASIDPTAGTIRLASGEQLTGDLVVVAAGVWVGALLPALVTRLTPSRQVVVRVSAPDALAESWQSSTMLTDVLQGEEQSVFYAVPPLRGYPIKFGDHCFSKGGNPEAHRTPGIDEIERVLAAARRRLLNADDYHVIEAKTCFYTLTEDERFSAERIERVMTLAGFSGHGFKFAPLIGEQLARVIEGELGFDAFRLWLAGTAAGA